MVEIQKITSQKNDTIKASIHNERYLMAPHIHLYAELIYVIEGEFTVISSHKREIAKTGDIVLVQPYQPHGFFTPNGKTVKFWMLLFESNIINDIMLDGYSCNEYSKMVFTPSEELRIFLRNRMIDTDEKDKTLDVNELRKLKATLYPILDEYLSNVSVLKNREQARSNSISETLRYLSYNFKNNVTLKEVSAAIGYSTSHISHSLSDIMGMNFRAVLNSIRIAHAKSLLHHNTNQSILLVSIESGFGSERSFHRVFKEITDMTPKEYKERLIQRNICNK